MGAYLTQSVRSFADVYRYPKGKLLRMRLRTGRPLTTQFFRWISERYPLTSQLITPNSIPTFDNL